jgi:hypothetical protein
MVPITHEATHARISSTSTSIGMHASSAGESGAYMLLHFVRGMLLHHDPEPPANHPCMRAALMLHAASADAVCVNNAGAHLVS